jgi:hypothetical protein
MGMVFMGMGMGMRKYTQGLPLAILMKGKHSNIDLEILNFKFVKGGEIFIRMFAFCDLENLM